MENQNTGTNYQELMLRQQMQKLTQRINSAKGTLFIIGALTIINALLELAESGVSFVAGGYMPLLLTWLFAADKTWNIFYVVFSVLFGAAFLIMGGLFKKSERALSLTGAVIYTIDMIAMFVLIAILSAVPESELPFTSFIVDIAVHIILLVSLYSGFTACRKLEAVKANISVLEQQQARQKEQAEAAAQQAQLESEAQSAEPRAEYAPENENGFNNDSFGN
ncbi:MAG: hypothetical protein KH354_04925 [Clostridiales bacterium]|nr:hypothetical protein [Clostridiales bacterium]